MFPVKPSSRCTELIPCVEVRKKTFVTQPAVPQTFPSHPMVKCGNQISAEVPSNCRLKPQTTRHVHRNFLKKFRGARTVAQLALHMAVSPRPKAIRGIENARINSPTPLVLGPNPEGWYRGGVLVFVYQPEGLVDSAPRRFRWTKAYLSATVE